MHAWLFSSVFSTIITQRLLWLLLHFLLKLASSDPGSVKPVVIPALSNVLDSSLPADRTLCPVRALKYYLDRTKELRVGKFLLVISLKPGFTKDIAKAAVSLWIK